MLALAPVARARSAVSLSLYVTFSTSGSIAVTLPSGAPVGSSTGAPTVIPAGYYTLDLSGPEGCSEAGNFELEGPGVNVTSDLESGSLASTSFVEYFEPDSTYTWVDGTFPGVVYTFVTSGDVEGTSPVPAAVSPPGFVPGPGTPSQDPVGSQATPAPFRGTLAVTVSSTGALAVRFKGRAFVVLAAGQYTVTVVDRSRTSGFVLQQSLEPPIAITADGFVGRRSVAVDLTSGQWFFGGQQSGKRVGFRVTG